jgi:prophage DNA circulation protein
MQRALVVLLEVSPTRGRPGSDLRTACGDLSANAERLIQNDIAGPPLLQCFQLAQVAGISQKQLAVVRHAVTAETPLHLGARLIQNSIIEVCLSIECMIIANMVFTSRDDVDALRLEMDAAFEPIQDLAADDMDEATYRALITLHAALSYHLVETARPLPRMLLFRFAAPMPTLIVGQRLYYDAGRADELRDENHVVHPAFMLPTGRALSA